MQRVSRTLRCVTAVPAAVVLAAGGLIGPVGAGAAQQSAERPVAESATGPGRDGDTAGSPDPKSIRLQDDFDHIGAEVHSLTRDGRTSHYIDEGEPGDRVVVFLGGQGTSLEAFQLTEFARTSREELGLRVVSVERNGFGQSDFDASLGYDEYVDEVLAVLDHLDVDRFVVMAISGGGAYAAHLAARVPDRVISVHAAAASPTSLPTAPAPTGCDRTMAERNAENEEWTHHPMDWWSVPDSPVLAVPGWQATAYLDAVRSFYLRGSLGDPTPLSHEGALPCGADAVADTSRITSPSYLYWGGEDEVVPLSAMHAWEAALPNVARATVYDGEGHTVQYRHWDQILVDMAGLPDYTVVCAGGHTRLEPADRARDLVAEGATLGLCAWAADSE